mgnify:CR=1 FL=1
MDNSSHSKQTLSYITLNSLHKKSLLDLSICKLRHTSYKLKLKNLTLTFVLIYVTVPRSLTWEIDCFCCGFVWGFCFCVDDMKLCLIPCLEEMQDHWGTSVSLFWSTFKISLAYSLSATSCKSTAVHLSHWTDIEIFGVPRSTFSFKKKLQANLHVLNTKTTTSNKTISKSQLKLPNFIDGWPRVHDLCFIPKAKQKICNLGCAYSI